MPTMPPEVRDQWIADLKSGKFKQGRSFLKAIDHIGDTPRYCCLGVLAEQLCLLKQSAISNLRWGVADNLGSVSVTHFRQPDSVGLSEREQSILMSMNDRDRMDFIGIAHWIEHNL